MPHRQVDLAEYEPVSVAEFQIRLGRLFYRKAKKGSRFNSALVDGKIGTVQIDRRIPPAFERRHRAHMVNVGVGQQDRRNAVGGRFQSPDNARGLGTGIDHHGVAAWRGAEDVAVGLERADRQARRQQRLV